MRVVITGGPGSGKTTLVEFLGQRGFATVPEAAILVIEDLNRAHGVEGQKAWRRAHREAFQQAVLGRQIDLERAAEEAEVVFLDRGRLDGLAYCRFYGLPVPPDYARRAREGRYDRVFVLDTLRGFEDRGATGRTSGREESVALGRLLEDVYREAGYAVERLPELDSSEARAERVLAHLGLAAGDRRRGV